MNYLDTDHRPARRIGPSEMPVKRASQKAESANFLGQTADLAVTKVGNRNTARIGIGLFSVALLLLVAAGIVRSAIATRLDGFTIDED